MKLKKNIYFLVIIICTFFVIYIFAAARPLGKELQLIPAWTIDTSQSPVNSSTETRLPFNLGQTMGYFTADGKIVDMQTFPYKASISSYYYVQYGRNADNTPFYHSDGTQAGVIKQSGFPFFDENRIFVFLPGGTSFIQCSPDGSEKWRYEGVIPITAFSSSAAGCIAGFADGTLCKFSPEGNILQDFTPGGSDYPVILGADLSPDGNYLACISGQSKQRIVLARCDKGHCIITFFKYFTDDQTRQALVKFSKKNDTLYYNYAGGLGIVDCSSGKNTEIAMAGQIITIQESEVDNTVYILTRSGKSYSVYIIEAFDNMIGSFSFNADSAFILTKGDALYIGRNSRISSIKLSKK